MLDGVVPTRKADIHSLGILMDKELVLEVQVVAMSRSVYYQLRLLCQLHPLLDKTFLVMVTHALISSKLDYCKFFYVGLHLKATLVNNATA